MTDMDCEAASWPSGMVTEGLDLFNNVIAKDPIVAISNTRNFDGVEETISNNNRDFVSVGETINDNNGNFVGVGETISNNSENFATFEETINNNNENFVRVGEAISNNNGNYVGVEPFVGMEFDTIETSHIFWEKYAHDTGFRARIRSSKRKNDGVIRSRTYVCSKEGTSSGGSRCSCGVTMIISLIKGKKNYRVTTFNGKHNHGLESHLDNSANSQSVCKPTVGMEFDTIEASQVFWGKYANNVGFRGRIRSSKRSKDGVVRSRKYVCSREGKKCEKSDFNKLEDCFDTRCGCGVLMTISLVKEKGTYRVVKFFENHNHGFEIERNVHRRKTSIKRVSKVQARAISVSKGAGNLVLKGPLFNLTNAERMGILCTEFMQLAYRAVGNDEVFEGVRHLIKDGHSLADKY